MKPSLTIKAPESKITSGEIHLPGSKSISNRALIMRASAGANCRIHNLSDAQDTVEMERALTESADRKVIDAGNGGTTFRFLTAYFAAIPGERILTCGDQMKRRPIGILVDALRGLGAEIEYLENAGFPPIRISGGLRGGEVEVEAGVSGQFLSAVAMAAPLAQNPITMILKGEPVSLPYFKMTLEMMREFGARFTFSGDRLTVEPGKYSLPELYEVESDWSAASYWYSVAALGGGGRVVLKKLFRNSLQGDSAAAQFFRELGVKTRFVTGGIQIERSRVYPARDKLLIFDLLNTPDLAQTIAVTVAGPGQRAELRNIQTLRIKETDRVEALRIELEKLGVKVTTEGERIMRIEPADVLKADVEIETYGDHRMAMAFAPLALRTGQLTIKDPDVVRKSYPGFWDDARRLGFRL